ncbi:MAG: Rieske 2Fe-2S domain-containing protein [Bacteroidetes bacterium]|nr:Rieske 2Fe-2S domain-containing protein [Bacteroidota bacterium]
MTRKEFLASLGIGAAFVLTTNCLSSCTKDSSGPVDFTLDLSDPNFSSLNTNGNYLIHNGVVVAKTTSGSFVAATNTCSHEGQKQVKYDKSNNNYYCTAHGARFDLQGNGLNSTGNKGLTIYNTSLNGTSLRVFS